MCALPQLYVKVGPPWKNFLDPRLYNQSLIDGQRLMRDALLLLMCLKMTSGNLIRINVVTLERLTCTNSKLGTDR